MAGRSVAERMAAFDARQRASGLTRVAVWVPDTSEGRDLIRSQARVLTDRHRREQAARSERPASKVQTEEEG